MIVLADTGALYALLDRDDVWHSRVLEWWRLNGAVTVVPSSVLPEVCYLLQRRIGPRAEEAFVRSVADGEFVLEDLEMQDVSRAADIMRQYEAFPVGFVDASLVALAERLWTVDVLTTDRRHFTALRPRHARALALHPG